VKNSQVKKLFKSWYYNSNNFSERT
jgi:hypothetical protein